MSITKGILLFIVLIFFSYILYKLFVKRQLLKSGIDGFTLKNSIINPFRTEQQAMDGEFESVQSTKFTANIDNHKGWENHPMKEICILSSYNSAVTGNYVNLDMVKYAIERGYRLLDFEIFPGKDNMPFVGDDGKNIKNNIRLFDVLKTVTDNAFTSPCPNPKDPLFVHLRISSRNDALYKNIGTLLNADTQIGSYVHKGRVNDETRLSALLGKLIIIINDDNISCSRSKDKVKLGDCSDQIYKSIGSANITSNHSIFSDNVIRLTEYQDILKQTYKVPSINREDMTTNLETDQIQFVAPYTTSNPVIKPLICDHGIQIIGNQLRINDNNLVLYEKVFDAHKSAFVPLAQLIIFLKSTAYDNLSL
jgi:hypothetical protein